MINRTTARKIAGVMAVVTGALCMLMAVPAPVVAAQKRKPTLAQQIRANQRAMKEARTFITEAEQYLEVMPDGKLGMKVGAQAAAASGRMSPEARQLIEAAAAELNPKVAAGEIMIDPQLGVHPIGITTSANENNIQRYWWGNRYALDWNRTDILVRLMRVGAMIAAVIPAEGWIVGLIVGLGSELLDWLNRPHRGVFIYVAFSRVAWATSQP